jgi:hypothetical protein
MIKYYYSDGTSSKIYSECKILHRKDGPAIEDLNGTMQWFINGKLSRLDGPAIEWKDGDKRFYINGVYLTEKKFEAHPLRKKYLIDKEIERMLDDTSR